MLRWVIAFALTQAVEIPVYERSLRPRRLGARLAIAAGASTLTHPVVWFVAPKLVPGGWLSYVLVAEAFAVLIEFAWLRAFGVDRALWWAVLANALSVGIGMLLRIAFGWP